MSLQDVGAEGPTLWMGTYYPDPGFIMEDLDGDDIWSHTLDLEPGTYTYKFRNGWWDDWNTGSGWEEVPAECEVGQYGDREVIVTDQDMTIDTVCFNSCTAECNEVIYSNVTFQVDMTDENLAPDDIVYVQGTFNGWCGYCNPMTDLNNDGIYSESEFFGDDIGLDGVAPGELNYTGPDQGEGNHRPDFVEGVGCEPNFAETDVSESDMIGLTSFRLFPVPSHSQSNQTWWFKNDQAMWNLIGENVLEEYLSLIHI